MKRFLLLLLPATLIGCAGTPPPEEHAAANEPGTVCEREQPTGSRRIIVSCRSTAQRDQDRRDVDALSEATRRTRPFIKPGA